ncbi:MAG: TetR family transcriptional regulator [Rhizobiaceae bacterium]|nr:TetR family transcriptional regulator [Rhizobiaceae bacterium]
MTTWNGSVLSREHVRGKKRDAVVQQAAMEFRKRGYHATSMDDIATALGVTKGALYRYVKSKDEVLFECFMHSNRIGEIAIDMAEKVKGTALEKLRCFLNEFIKAYLDSNFAGGAMVEIGALLPDQRHEVVRGRDRVDQRLRGLLREGIDEGSILAANPKLMIFSFMGSINWIPSWFSPQGEWTSDEIAHQITEIILSGISARSS